MTPAAPVPAPVDPLGGLGLPFGGGFTGGDAGPAISSAEGKQVVNAWLASSFAVGRNADAETSAAAGGLADPANAGNGLDAFGASASTGPGLVALVAGGVGLVVLAVILRKGGGK